MNCEAGCGPGQHYKWVQKEIIKCFSEINPLLTTKGSDLRATSSQGNSHAAEKGCFPMVPHCILLPEHLRSSALETSYSVECGIVLHSKSRQPSRK